MSHQVLIEYRSKTMQRASFPRKKFVDICMALYDSNYQIITLLGKGSFGEVFLTKHRQNKRLYAVKIINKLDVKKRPFMQIFIDQEINIMKQLNHPNIVRFEHQFTSPDLIIIVMEYCEHGNLLTYQSKLPGQVFPLEEAIKVIVQVMKALKCIHEKRFIHRDIKSENILLTKKEGNFIFKIGDFGFARAVGAGGAKTQCGTEWFMAPEILNNIYYGISVDIWALGVLFYHMLFKEYPFKSNNMKEEIQKKCIKGFNLRANLIRKDKLQGQVAELEDFFKRIFVIDCKKRISFSNIVKHPLFRKYEHQFKENDILQKKLQKFKIDEFNEKWPGQDNFMEPKDDLRSLLPLKKRQISYQSKDLVRELQEIFFEIDKVHYLIECADQIYNSYGSYFSYPVRLAAKYYLLKMYLFYAEPLLQQLCKALKPNFLYQAKIDFVTWIKCTNTLEFKQCLIKMWYSNMKVRQMFEDTYHEVKKVLKKIPIKQFINGYKPTITEKLFNDLKQPYRKTLGFIFESINKGLNIDSHTSNKINMRLLCCYMINRIFKRQDIPNHFPIFIQWLKANKIQYKHSFDFVYFKKWILDEKKQNLQICINKLGKQYFS